MSIAITWGTNTYERLQTFACDNLLPTANFKCWRGVTIEASPELIYKWLCQMRIAPYSYDLLDNLGRLSPQELKPGLENLKVGQRVMLIFKLVSFVPNQEMTLELHSKAFARMVVLDSLALTYLIIPENIQAGAECRLLVKVVGLYPNHPLGWAAQHFLAWGDLLMMRRQLLNFKRLAERDYKKDKEN